MHPQSDSISRSIKRLPAEIVDMVCQLVQQDDIANLRLTSRFLNDVATPYLLKHLEVTFNRSSFDRVLEISKHPIISKHITGLIYEPNSLAAISRGEWEAYLPACDPTQTYPLPPFSNSLKRIREIQRWQRVSKTCAKSKVNPYSKTQLDDAWASYQQHLEEQRDLRKCGYGVREFTDVFNRFTNLSEVTMNHIHGIKERPGEHSNNPYYTALANVGSHKFDCSPAGVQHVRSLLTALHEAKTRLVGLRIGNVS